MVKAGTLPDYYGDLELKPGADPNDVKKQYKKLALKYHPDRNPGHEAEFAAKFQAIQAANEVLTDPAQRAKYDAQRMRQGLLSSYVAAPPPRPNVPPRTQTTNFPPPPRPPPTSANKTTFYTPPTGAPRYSRFSRADTGWSTTGTDDARSKTNDFKAWEQMRHGQGPIPPRRAPPPKAPPRPTAFETDRTPSPARSPPRRTSNDMPKSRRGAWESLRDAGMPNISRANTTRAPPKKAGFAPSPPDHDEPPARSAYFNVFQGERPPSSKTSTDMPPPPPRAPTSKKPDPLPTYIKNSFGVNNNRVSTPYHTPGGEKTFLASPGLQRSSTTTTPRESSSRTGWYDKDSVHLNGEHVRAASASTTDRGDRVNMAGRSSSTTTDTSSSSDDEAETLRAGSRGTTLPKSRKARMPAGAGVRHQTGFSPHVRVEDVEDEAEAPHTFLDTSFRRHSGIDLRSQEQVSNSSTQGFAEYRTNPKASQPSPQPSGTPGTTSSGERFMQRPRSFDDKYASHPDDPSSNASTKDKNNKTPMYAKPGFREPRDGSTRPFAPAPPLRSHSSDTIDVKFSPGGAPPKFGSDNTFFPLQSSDRPNKSNTFPVQAQWDQQSPAPREHSGNDARVPLSGVPPPPPKGPSKYSSEDWDKRFSANTFEPPPAGSSSRTSSRKRAGTPRMGSLNNMKRAGTFSRVPEFQPTVVDAVEEPSVNGTVPSDSLKSSATSSRVSTGSDGSAMDIDSIPPPMTDGKLKASDGDVHPTQSHDIPTYSHGPPLPPRVDVQQQAEPDSGNIDLGGFKNVAPFAPSNEGLNGIDDLTTGLPFESRASTTRPNFDNCSKKLNPPRVPKTPSPPSTLTPTSWNRYLTDMNAYIFKWNTFSAQMLLLFQNRQEEHREIGPSWVGQVGGDADAYLQALDEDERARKYWEIASEKHKECFQELKRVREDILRSQSRG